MKSIKKNVLTIVAMIMMAGFTTSVMAQVPDTQHENNMGTQEEIQTPSQEQNQQTLPQEPQDHMRTQEEGTFPQEQNQLGDVEAEYDEEIEESELPATVSTSLETMYPDSEIEKVYRGTDSSYKVKVKNGDEKSVIYYDANGTFVKEKDKDDKDKDENKDW